MNNNPYRHFASIAMLILFTSFIIEAQIPFFHEDFNKGIPNTWTSAGGKAQFMACDSTCLKAHDMQYSFGFYKAIENGVDGAIAGATVRQGCAALKAIKQTDLSATLTSPVINCSGKSKVFASFVAVQWGGANSDSLLSSGNATTTCFLRVSNNGTTWKSYKIFDFNIRRILSAFIDISDVAANQNTVYLQFIRTGDANNDVFLVDEVSLMETAPKHNVTVRVDMSNERVSSKGVYIANDLTPNGEWKSNAIKMTSIGDGIYEGSMAVPQLSMAHYKFMNGDSWGQNESVLAGCGVINSAGSYDRLALGKAADYELKTVCFGACMQCGDRARKSVYEYCPRDANVIYCENFEGLQFGKLVPQNDNWTTYGLAFNGYNLTNVNDNPRITGYWDGNTNYDGSHALRITTNTLLGTVDEPMLNFGNPTTGSYQVDFKIYVAKDRSAAIAVDDIDGNSGFTLDFSGDSLYLLEFFDYIDFNPHLMATPAKYKTNDWNDVSFMFNAATNAMTVKLNGKTILNNVVNKSQTGYAFLDFTTLDIITEFEAASDYFIDDAVYKKLPNTNLLAEKSKLGAYTAISPNPANDQIVVSPDINTQGAWQVRLLNNLGQLISRETGTAESPLVIETSAYKSGMYFIDFQSEGAHWTKKVVIQH